MRKILAFAGSNSPTSINHQLLLNLTKRFETFEVEILDLKDLNIPMYSIVREKEGIPEDVKYLYEKIESFRALIVGVNEYNANISGFFKNILDWLSRVDRKFFLEKKILLISTSPGQRGGASAMEYCRSQFPRFGGEVVESFSLPRFYENFDSENGIITNRIFERGVQDITSAFIQNLKE